MREQLNFLITPEEDGLRIDQYLAQALPAYSRSYLQKIIRNGGVLCNTRPAKAGLRLTVDDEVQLTLPEAQNVSVMPEPIPLDILYEDADVLVVNKPQGMVVHPSAGHESGTLVHALLYHCRDSLSGINGVLRPGIVHRIDKDTSGLLVVCKNDAAHRHLAEQLAGHTCIREYQALVHGVLSEETRTIRGNIGRDPKERKRMAVVPEGSGKPAVTHVTVRERLRGYSLLTCRLETGRTHQIRVHLASQGHPVLGDPLYGPRKCPFPELNGQLLHAGVLGFTHPVTGSLLRFEAPPPALFNKTLQKLEAML